MSFQYLPLKKGRVVARHSISSWTKRERRTRSGGLLFLRALSTAPKESAQEKVKSEVDKITTNGKSVVKNGQSSNRDFFLSILGSSPTKREVRAYLQRFTPPKHKSPATKVDTRLTQETTDPIKQYGVNLGSFYRPRAVNESPRFTQQPDSTSKNSPAGSPLHVALVKIKAPQTLDDDILFGVTRTLSQLRKLGMISIVVVDCADSLGNSLDTEGLKLRDLMDGQSDRVVAAIEKHGEPGARRLDGIMGVSEESANTAIPKGSVQGRFHVRYRKLLMTPLRRGVIPVVGTIGFTDETSRAVLIRASDVILALTRELAGLECEPVPDEDPKIVAERLKLLRNEVSLDRLIILDPLGGIPRAEMPDRCHIFLNLEQEFEPVKQSLLSVLPTDEVSKDLTDCHPPQQVSNIAREKSFSPLTETEFTSTLSSKYPSRSHDNTEGASANNTFHLQNLELVHRVLSLLPPSSSALLTTPMEAANSGKVPETSQAIGVGTRRQRNPLIHNLLTDKPVYSSSLPAGRLGPSSSHCTGEKASQSAYTVPTTFAKRGLSVSIFPDPRIHPWKPCLPGQTPLALTDTAIDLPRLVHLIDDSFDRKLDVPSYLERVNDRIAGIIIAGEYEGGALFTWEIPPGDIGDSSNETRARMVPYLDKFAVLKSSQGAGGVADILFKTMVKECFPHGVCWRSRRDNPVNRWYFERSRGTWKLPHTNWTMFWTTPDLDLDPQRFCDYEGVCKSIVPTWADNKKIMD